MDTATIGTEHEKANPIHPKESYYSFYQPVWHFVLLSILTFGLYDVYWYYKNWKYLKSYKGLEFSPVWRTVGLFIPIYNLILLYNFHKDYRDLVEEEGISRAIYPGRIILVIMASFVLVRLPDPYWMLSFVSVIPLAMVQSVLNDLWDKVQPDKRRREALRVRQVMLIVIGALIWLLSIYAMLLPEG